MIRRNFVMVLVTLVLFGCQQAPRPMPAPSLSFTAPKIALNVQAIDVFRDDEATTALPRVERYIPITFETAVRDWVKNRFTASGQIGRAVVILKQGTMTEKVLRKKRGIEALFTYNQQYQYEGIVHVQIFIEDENGDAKGFAEGKVTRLQTIDEAASPEERQALWAEMLRAIMNDLDIEIEKHLREKVGAYLL